MFLQLKTYAFGKSNLFSLFYPYVFYRLEKCFVTKKENGKCDKKLKKLQFESSYDKFIIDRCRKLGEVNLFIFSFRLRARHRFYAL